MTLPPMRSPARSTSSRKSDIARNGSAYDRRSNNKEEAMVLGLSLATFTRLHVLISLSGIVSGFVVMAGLLAGNRMKSWTVVFLATTVATSATGFLFPFHAVTPAIIL